jgi:hypothetical protein
MQKAGETPALRTVAEASFGEEKAEASFRTPKGAKDLVGIGSGRGHQGDEFFVEFREVEVFLDFNGGAVKGRLLS